MLETKFVQCVLWPYLKAKVFVTILNGHTWRWVEKFDVAERSNNAHFQTVCQSSVVHMKCDRSSCVKNDKRQPEREKFYYSYASAHHHNHCLKGHGYQIVNFGKIIYYIYHMIIFTINWLIVLSIECQKTVKNAHYNFPEPKMELAHFLFYSTLSPKPKDVPFRTIYWKEKAAKSSNVGPFGLKDNWDNQ